MMQNPLKHSHNSLIDISESKVANVAAKTIIQKLKVVKDGVVADSTAAVGNTAVELEHGPWAERQSYFAPAIERHKHYYDHCGHDCSNRVAVIAVGSSAGKYGVGQKLAENLPSLTRKSICYFDIGNDYDLIEDCLARHKHVIIVNCADQSEGPALSLSTASSQRKAQSTGNFEMLTTYELKQPYVMRKDDGISSASQNALIADELAFISLNRNLPRTWLFLVNPDHTATHNTLCTAKSNAYLDKRSDLAAIYQASLFSGFDQNISPDMEVAIPRLTLRLQTLINDLLAIH